jgi:ATP-dependent Lon protease
MPEPITNYPEQTGLMILPWVTLFPGAMMPLKIFEDRYQEMIAHSLLGNRMFAIAHTLSDEDSCESLGGIGMIRACVTNPDGTSNLVLQGVTRVAFQQIHLNPYPRSEMLMLADPDESNPCLDSLRRSIMASFRSQAVEKLGIPDGYVNHLDAITTHGAFADLLASTVFENPQMRRLIFQELDVVTRMELLEKFLLAGVLE